MKKSLFLVFAAIGSRWLKAQETIQNVDHGLRTNEGLWYASPWIWITGAAILILLLVVLTKNKKDE